MNQALILEGVSKRYGAFEAVKNLSFSVDKGSICGFLGPNGAGKTSTIRMILGLTAPTEGSIMVLGADDGRKVRDRIGFLPEERGLYRKMTPVDAVAYFASLKGVPPSEGRKRAREMLEAQGLGDALKRPMKSLSKGMAQKVQLVAAIAHRPELVILDEPFSGLDPVNQQGLERVIRDLADQGATVLFSTHVMQHAERLCRKVVLLAKGQKVFEGDVAPWSARSRMTRSSPCWFTGSRPEKGSSRMTSSGRWAMAATSWTFWAMPLDRDFIGRLSASPSPCASSISRARLRPSDGGTPLRLAK